MNIFLWRVTTSWTYSTLTHVPEKICSVVGPGGPAVGGGVHPDELLDALLRPVLAVLGHGAVLILLVLQT